MNALTVSPARMTVIVIVAALAIVAPGAGSAQDGPSAPPEIVVLARSDNPADALGAGPVAGILGAPVLVTLPSRLVDVAADALQAHDPDLVVLAGGEAALSAQVEADVEALGYPTRRAAGNDRFETATLLAALLTEYNTGRPVLTGAPVTDQVIRGLNAELLQGLTPDDLRGQEGPQGPMGPAGPKGPEGPEGPAGQRTAMSPEQIATLSWWEDPTRPATVNVGDQPWAVAFDGSHIWIANSGSDDVSRIDPATDTVVATIDVGIQPTGVAFDGTHIWVANPGFGANDVAKIDPSTNTVVANVSVGASPVAVAFDGTHLWVLNHGEDGVSKVDPSTDTEIAAFHIGDLPRAVAFDGTYVWTTHLQVNYVAKIDPDANTVVNTVDVGFQPSGVAFDGTHLWVANRGSGTVSKVDPAADTVVATIDVGGMPVGVAFDGRNIWIANSSGNSVTKLRP